MPDLTLFHTAEMHVATFSALAPNAQLCHVVRPDWLTRAQSGIDPDLAAEISAEISAASGPVLCTCTTLGPFAETLGAIRVDWPMMQQAAAQALKTNKPVLMVYCLNSTAAPSETLLRRAYGSSDARIDTLALPQHWPLFDNGKIADFHAALAQDIAAQLSHNDYACVVLAQASMAGAADILAQQTSVPVLASPAIAIQQILAA